MPGTYLSFDSFIRGIGWHKSVALVGVTLLRTYISLPNHKQIHHWYSTIPQKCTTHFANKVFNFNVQYISCIGKPKGKKEYGKQHCIYKINKILFTPQIVCSIYENILSQVFANNAALRTARRYRDSFRFPCVCK